MNALNFKSVFLWGLGLAFAACATTGTVRAQVSNATFPILVISDPAQRSMDVETRMGFLVDTSKHLNIDQVRYSLLAWQPILRTSPGFGFSQDAYWFRFQIDNQTGKEISRLIELPRPSLDDVQLFHQAKGEILVAHALGDEKPFAQRALIHPNFVMPVKLAAGMNQIYLRLATAGALEAPLRIWEPNAFQESSADTHMLTAAMMGMLLVMVVYNLFVLASTRDISYAYYIAFVSSYLLFWATLNGYAFQYLWPNAVHWNGLAISTFVATACVSACLFIVKFLKLQAFFKIAFQWMSVLTLASTILLVATFVAPYHLTVVGGMVLILTVAISALGIGYWRWYQGAQFARMYCLAWTSVFIGIGIFVVSKFGVLPANIWLNNASQIGILMLVVLLSLTLADRINNDRSLRLNAQAVALAHAKRARSSQFALIQATAKANQDLERRVAARTTELNATLAQLQAANNELQRLSTTDGLTQIGNRAFFDQALLTELKRAHRLGQPLALILFDIDHFKKINDTYGHPAGDACLRHLSALMRYKVQRAGDMVARYGGEEFVILLLNSTLPYAMGFANEFRKDLENSVVTTDVESIRLTASFGVASVVPDAYFTAEQLIIEADKALYQAKREGRNCVRAALVPSASSFDLLG